MLDTLPHFPRLIAVTGQEGSGKDSYGDHLAGRGYLHVSAGDVIRSQARALGHTDPIPRSILSQIGDEMKKEFGPSPIVESTLARYEQEQVNYPAGLVISGLRRIGELKAFREHGAISLWIHATDEQRFANQSYRGRDDQQNFADFVERGKKEYFGNTEGGQDGVNLQAIEAMADFRVKNDKSLEELFQNADTLLSKISK